MLLRKQDFSPMCLLFFLWYNVKHHVILKSVSHIYETFYTTATPPFSATSLSGVDFVGAIILSRLNLRDRTQAAVFAIGSY
jgi:hypothetical protein